jgi:hypothetical protein
MLRFLAMELACYWSRGFVESKFRSDSLRTAREQPVPKSVKRNMKLKRLKIVGLVAALVSLGLIFLVSTNAQQDKGKSSTASMTTNWIGYVVFGAEESMDPIGRGAYPTADTQVQIGLRSDGVVVWRTTPAKPGTVVLRRAPKVK